MGKPTNKGKKNLDASTGKENRLLSMRSTVIFWVVFVLLMLVSAWLRIGVPHEDLMGETNRYSSVDAYYHLMEADYTYENWPEIRRFNPIMTFPEGAVVGQRPLNNWLMATIAKFGGFSVSAVGAYWPAILGVLVLIPALFIGWLLWGRWAALIGVGLLAVIQGEFFGRTSLGFCDHHALEVFLSTMVVWFFILALKRHWYWAFGSGILLGLHLTNWAGSPVLSILILIFLGIQVVWNHWKGQSNRDVCLVSFITLCVSFLAFYPIGRADPPYMLFLISAIFVPPILYGISLATARFKAFWYPVVLLVGSTVGLALMWRITPITRIAFIELSGLFGMVGKTGQGLERTVSEIQPLLMPYGEFTMNLVWGGYGLIAVVGIIGLVLLGIRTRTPEALFMVVWSLGMVGITLMQRRFGYYSAVNLCLLSGYLCWVVMSRFGWRKRSNKQAKKKGLDVWYFRKPVAVFGVIVILVFMAIPSYMWSSREAKYHPYAITPAWMDAVNWLKTETPDTDDYSVVSWWDYGYWILREGERPAPCHPGGGSADRAARFFTAQSTEEANIVADVVKCKYVVIDYLMVTKKFYAMPILTDRKEFTDANYNDSMICRLYYSEDGIPEYRQVFESTQIYEGHGQVKIYERYEPEPEPQRGCGCE